MKTIFVVDDSDANLVQAKETLDDAYRTFALSSAKRMFEFLDKVVPDLILLDINMPEMDGMEALALLKKNTALKSIPVIFLTANNDTNLEIRGFELGAVDFITKPFSPPVLLKRVEMHIDVDSLIKRSIAAVNDAHNATIRVIANMVERRDQATGSHIERTQAFMRLLINELIRTETYSDEISKWDLSVLLPSSQLHDVGKIVISDAILNKPGKLTEEEFELVKKHSEEGESIINEITRNLKDEDSVFFYHARRIAKNHHERWDGSGYPNRLKGEEIPLEGRIMALADVYDSLIAHDRPYKDHFTHEKAVEIIESERGLQFDPEIVDAFLSIEDDFRKESIRSGIMQNELPAGNSKL